ncbi:MAG TPA: hypothetical protein V6D35_16410 [Candidatus Sericytochromatia bacterium]
MAIAIASGTLRDRTIKPLTIGIGYWQDSDCSHVQTFRVSCSPIIVGSTL